MIYFYRHALLKHLGFIITFGKSIMGQSSNSTQGSNHIFKPFSSSYCCNPVKIKWVRLFFSRDALFHIHTLELSSYNDSLLLATEKFAHVTIKNFCRPQQSATFGFHCCSVCRLAGHIGPALFSFFSASFTTNTTSPANDQQCQLLNSVSVIRNWN